MECRYVTHVSFLDKNALTLPPSIATEESRSLGYSGLEVRWYSLVST